MRRIYLLLKTALFSLLVLSGLTGCHPDLVRASFSDVFGPGYGYYQPRPTFYVPPPIVHAERHHAHPRHGRHHGHRHDRDGIWGGHENHRR